MKLTEINTILEHLKERPAMWIHPVTISSMTNFLNGFRSGYSAAFSPEERINDIWFEAQTARGWQSRASGPVAQMQEAGHSDDEILRELVEIEKATAERVFENNRRTVEGEGP